MLTSFSFNWLVICNFYAHYRAEPGFRSIDAAKELKDMTKQYIQLAITSILIKRKDLNHK